MVNVRWQVCAPSVAMVLVFLLVAATAVSGLAEQYEVLLSKDEPLCTTVLEEINRNIGEYREIRYAEHQKTPAVYWRPMFELPSLLEDTNCEKFLWAKADINNDGKLDLVVKYSSCFRELLTDDLYFFDKNYKGLESIHSRQDLLAAYWKAGRGEFGGNGYSLVALPSAHDEDEDRSIDGSIVVNPFRYHDATYVHIDSVWLNSKNAYLHVVAKYSRERLPSPDKRARGTDRHSPGQHIKGLEDICYFKMQLGAQARDPVRSDDGLTLQR